MLSELYGLRVGETIQLDGAVGKIVQLDRRTITLQTDGELSALSIPDYLSILAEGPNTVDPADAFALDMASDEDLRRAEALACHIREINTGYPYGRPTEEGEEPDPRYDRRETTSAQRVASKSKELSRHGSIVGPRGKSTLELDRKKYRERGIAGLLDGRGLKASLKAKSELNPAVSDLIQSLIEKRSTRATATKKAFLAEVVREAARREPPIKLPPKTRLREAIDELDRGLFTFGSSKTRQSAAKKPRGDYTRTDADYPGQWVQLDTTPIDIQHLNGANRVERAELSTAIDVATRSLLGWIFVSGKTNAQHISALLADCLVPLPMRPRWEESVEFSYRSLPMERAISLDERLASAAALPLIRPHNVVIDNGADYKSALVEENLARLGIGVSYARPASGWDKGVVERFFSTLNTQLWDRLPGATGRSVEFRGKDPKNPKPWGPIGDKETPDKRDRRRGLNVEYLNLDQIREIFAEYLVTVWQDRPHKGLRIPAAPGIDVSPNQAYDYHVATHGYVPIPPSAQSYFDMLPTAWRTIQPEGVAWQGRHYDSDQLKSRQLESVFHQRAGKHPFKYHPGDASHIYIYDRDTKEWLWIPWIWAHDVKRPFSAKAWTWVAQEVAAEYANVSAAEREQRAAAKLNDLLDRFERGEIVDKADARKAFDHGVATDLAADDRPPKPSDTPSGAIDIKKVKGRTMQSTRTE